MIANIPIHQATQALAYVTNEVGNSDGLAHLQPLGIAGRAAHFTLAVPGTGEEPTSVSLFDQGLL